MKQGKHSKPRKRGAVNPNQFPSLESVTRSIVPTRDAAYYLNREQQTMRVWACYENGPLHPIRLNGRLGWRVSDIKTLLGGQ